MPPKIWRPKVTSKYTIPGYGSNDVDEGFFDFTNYTKCIFCPHIEVSRLCQRDYVLLLDQILDMDELLTSLRINGYITETIINRVKQIIMDLWGCSAKEGAKLPILGYEFSINTGSSKPLCYKKKSYGPYESKIIMELLTQLLGNNWISKCSVPWGSLIVLAPKPHQEHIFDINVFIWIICVSYRCLNAITEKFKYPIPRCNDSINILSIGSQPIFIICFDARHGYHQISVIMCDREN